MRYCAVLRRLLPGPAAVRRLIPDIDSRVEVALVGTPLTHERFLRRHRGTYGAQKASCLAGSNVVLGWCQKNTHNAWDAHLLLLTTLPRATSSFAGPGIRAGEGLFPWPRTPVDRLYNCGDFAFPGMGTCVHLDVGQSANRLLLQLLHLAAVQQGSARPASLAQPAEPAPAVPPSPACAGIGLPAVAASGAVTANSLVSVGQHTALLKELGL